jgi:enoyl-CoA hydratase
MVRCCHTPATTRLTGTGSIFSAGVDLFRITRDGPDYVRTVVPLLSRVLCKLFAFRMPVVAALNGHAIAGGCVIALAADVRLMAERAGKIGVPELLVGVPFPAAALEVVRFAVPRDKLQSLIYSGELSWPRRLWRRGSLMRWSPQARSRRGPRRSPDKWR